MSQINCDTETKALFDELKPSDATQAEFFTFVMDEFQNRDEPVRIDTDAIVEQITHQVGGEIELAAYRGTKEAIEEIEIQ